MTEMKADTKRVERLTYPDHFLHDIENMSADMRDARMQELSHWSLRFANRTANPKWVTNHMFELARLAELTAAERDRLRSELEAAEALNTRHLAEIEGLREAARAVDEQAFMFYRAEDGTERSIEADDGEACEIVHSDAMFQLRAALSATPAREQHPDDLAVDRFAVAMKAKLVKKRSDGRGGWQDKENCSQQFLSCLLRDHVDKGDPVDVANFAMMLQQRSEEIAPERDLTIQEAARAMLSAYDLSISGQPIADEQRAAGRHIALAASFAADAYNKGYCEGQDVHALCKAFLTALADPLSPHLDYLRIDPAAGQEARDARAQAQGGQNNG